MAQKFFCKFTYHKEMMTHNLKCLKNTLPSTLLSNMNGSDTYPVCYIFSTSKKKTKIYSYYVLLAQFANIQMALLMDPFPISPPISLFYQLLSNTGSNFVVLDQSSGGLSIVYTKPHTVVSPRSTIFILLFQNFP